MGGGAPAKAQLPGNAVSVFEKFGTLNTKAAREAIGPNEFSWIENWMPLGDGNLRTLYDQAPALYTTANPRAVIYKYPFNIGSTSYMAVFLDNGTAVQVQISNGSQTTISATAGLFYFGPGSGLPACSQWQSKYLLIVSPRGDKNGYWVWDGSLLFGPGTLSPIVNVTYGGRNYTSPPTVTAYGGSGTGATFTATVLNGAVTAVAVTNPGSGYLLNDQVQLQFSGGGSDTSAVITPTVDHTSAGVARVQVATGGHGYSAGTYITFGASPGSIAQGVLQLVNGVITGVIVTYPGTGYATPPAITITDPASSPGSGGSLTAVLVSGQVAGFTIVQGGTNYQAPPTITVTGDGTGALMHATITGGVVTGVNIDNPGIGYTEAAITLSGGNAAATATISLMPFGVSGDTVETYQDRVWIGNVTVSLFTAADSVSDFATSSGGGAFPATDSHLRRKIIRYAAESGFLYQFGDSSINVISNVQTSGSPATTTFNNSDIDAQVGAAWRDSVVSFGRALVFANSSGVYALYGGAAEKVSAPLDGLFEKASFNTGQNGVIPTASVATIFGIRVYMLLFTTTDPYSNTLRNILAMWDGQRWFVGSQNVTPTIVSLQEIDSVLTAWGTDTTHVYKLFSVPSSSLSKVWQGKLMDEPGLWYGKQVNRRWLLAENNDPGGGATLNIEVDYIDEFGAYHAGTPAASTMAASGRTLTKFNPQTFGILIGMTGTTMSKDVTMIKVALLEDNQYNLNA